MSRLNDNDLEFINKTLKGLRYFNNVNEIKELSKDAIMSLIDDHLSNLIGYDPVKDDIDSLGEEADAVISKLLQLLAKRGEM